MTLCARQVASRRRGPQRDIARKIGNCAHVVGQVLARKATVEQRARIDTIEKQRLTVALRGYLILARLKLPIGLIDQQDVQPTRAEPGEQHTQ